MASYFSSSELLSQFLASGKNLIGQIVFSDDFSLRHCEDIDIDSLELKSYDCPEAAREIARYDREGNYRPLKTAPNLCRGWLLQLQNIEEMALALDFFYPAGLSLYAAWLEKKLEATPLRATLGRQSGMYRVTQLLSDEQAHSLIQQQCQQGCMRKVLWSLDADQGKSLSASADQEIPLLCREACNLLVAAARKIVKEKK